MLHGDVGYDQYLPEPIRYLVEEQGKLDVVQRFAPIGSLDHPDQGHYRQDFAGFRQSSR